MTTVSELIEKLTARSEGNLHDVSHFMKVYAYARTIGIREGLDPETQETLETAAVVHDIACPLCREKYGNTNGKAQEREGAPMAKAFLLECGVPEARADRAAWLTGHHHTYEGTDGPDHQILLEADYLVNAEESGYSKENIRRALQTLFRTKTGRALLTTLYLTQ